MKTNWQIKKLGEVCDFQRGLTYSKKDEVDFSDNIVLRSNNITLKSSSLNLKELRYINNKIVIPNNKKVKKGSIIICTANGSKSHLGKIALIDDDYKYAFGGFMGQLIPKEEIISKYFFYVLISTFYKDHLAKISSGANINNLKFSDLENFKIPLPPLREQRRIVKILDDVFEKIAKSKENTEKNLKNAKELFESYLQDIFTNLEKIHGETEFGEIIELLTDYHANGSYKVLKANVNLKKTEDYAWMVRSTDFENNFKNNKRYISEKSYNFLKKSKVFGGEIIVSKIGNAGKVYFMPKIDRPCSLAMNLFLIRLNEKKCSNKYVYWYLNSKYGRGQIESRVLGTTTKTITKDNVRSIEIPFPKSITEQKTIVKKLDTLSAETKKLEVIYKQKLNNLEELKKSVLKKAFDGEL